jgi:hypothetical protein
MIYRMADCAFVYYFNLQQNCTPKMHGMLHLVS